MFCCLLFQNNSRGITSFLKTCLCESCNLSVSHKVICSGQHLECTCGVARQMLLNLISSPSVSSSSLKLIVWISSSVLLPNPNPSTLITRPFDRCELASMIGFLKLLHLLQTRFCDTTYARTTSNFRAANTSDILTDVD